MAQVEDDTGLLSPTERNMQAAGIAIDAPAFEDYFGFDEKSKWYFPDGVQYIEYKLMDEGARAKYQKNTSRDIRLFKTSGDASVKMDPASERQILMETSVVGWHILRMNTKTQKVEPVPFGSNASSGSAFGQWLMTANPKFVSDLERDIRKANVWMNAELTAEAIREEIASLEEMLAEAVKREEGKSGS